MAFALAGMFALLSAGAVPGAEFDELRVGFSGQGRVGNTLPISVAASGLPAGIAVSLTVTAADPLGNQCLRTVARGTVDDGGRVSMSGTFAAGRLDGALRVAILDEAQQANLCEKTVAVRERKRRATTPADPDTAASDAGDSDGEAVLQLYRQSAEVMLCVGEPAGVREMASSVVSSRSDYFAAAVFPITELAAFPVTREGLDSVDLVFLTDDFRLSPEQNTALQQWVMTGGHLLVSCGATADDLLSTPLGAWLQSQFGIRPGVNTVVDLAPIQNFVPGAVQLQTNRFRVPMSRLSADGARVVVGSLDGPLIARRAVGTGVLTFVAVDLNQRPVSSWRSLPRLYEMLMFDQQMDSVTTVANRSIRISSSGISDLSTQLTSICDAIPAANRWSTWHVMALLGVYMILVGPLDYLLVVYLLKKPHLTWVTFPLIVLAGCAVIYGKTADDSWAVTSRALHLLDISQSSGTQTRHERTWVSVSAATTRRADLSVGSGGGEEVPEGEMSRFLRWFGRSEDVYGGMYREGGVGLGRQTYRQTQGTSHVLEGVPLLASGSQCFCCDTVYLNQTPQFESTLSSSGTGLLEGQMISRLEAPIRDWIVFYGNRVYTPSPTATEEDRQLRPGQTWNRRNRFVRTSDLRSYLNGSRIVPRKSSAGSPGGRTDSQQLATPYDPRNTDPLDIMTMVSFYDAAGSDAYVGLRNDLFRRMEISDSIRMNYAVMLGTVEKPLAEVRFDGEPLNPVATATVVRLLLPVSRDKPAPPAEIKPAEAAASPSQTAVPK